MVISGIINELERLILNESYKLVFIIFKIDLFLNLMFSVLGFNKPFLFLSPAIFIIFFFARSIIKLITSLSVSNLKLKSSSSNNAFGDVSKD